MKAIDIEALTAQPVYIIFGDDDYLVRRAKEAVCALADGAAKQFNVTEFEIPRTNYTDALNKTQDALYTLPIMADFRVIVADLGVSKLPKDLESRLIELIKSHKSSGNDFSVLAVLYRDSSPAAMNKFGEVIDCNRLSESELMPITQKMINERGYIIDPSTLRAFINRCDRYLSNIAAEAEKLYIASDDNQISMSTLDECLKEKGEYIIYEITDALSSGNKYSALLAITRLAQSYSNESDGAMRILNMLIAHYKRLFYGKINTLSDTELGKLLGCKPFAVTISRRAAAKYKPMQLKNALDKLLSIESGVKTGRIAVKEIIPSITCAVL